LTLTVRPRAGAPLGVESGELYVARVAPDTPAARAGLRRGDRLLTLDGAPLAAWSDVEAAQREKQDRPFELTWSRAGERFGATVAQAARTEVDEVRDRPITVFTFGAYGGLPALPPPLVDAPFRPLLAMEMAVESSWEITRKIVLGIGMILTGEIAWRNVGGPLQIFDITTQAAEQGWEV